MAADGPLPLRVVFWNTWLLRPRLWPGGPAIPGGNRFFAPDVRKRAPLVGQALAGRFDVCAMSEVFETSEQDSVTDAWEEAAYQPGPGRGLLRTTGSGLLTVVDTSRVDVIAVADHTYRAGGDVRDSDTFATKGALLVRARVRPGAPPAEGESPDLGPDGVPGTDEPGAAIDIVSTHLFAGGELFPIPGHDDHARHHAVRMAQVDELVEFIGREHDPTLPLLVVGDLNVAAHDHDPGLVDPEVRYHELADRLGGVDLVDLWPTYGIGAGSTCTFTDPTQIRPDPDDPDQVADLLDADPAAAPGDRIDYLWLAQPRGAEHPVVVVDRPRRWAFPGREARGGPAGSLSDHLALSVTLHLTPT